MVAVQRTLEKYEVLDEVGRGGMATVYRARDTRLDRLVALKVMHPHLQSAKEARTRFAREAQSVAKMRHPNILEVFDYSGEDSEECYMAAELLTGPTLKAFSEEQEDIPAEIAACIAIEILKGLAVAHSNGIVHRDVKPENILLHENKSVKLTDFGIAQMRDAQSFTATGQILGSPGHMAPEQVESGDCDERTDLFSLGTVLYVLATGRLPFGGKNPHQMIRRIMEGEFTDPLRVRPTIGSELQRIIKRSLAREPDDRFESAESFIGELERFVARIGIEDPTLALIEYLEDPEATKARLRDVTVQSLTVEGERALSRGAVPEALDHFNRVLAIDENNERVLKSIDRIGRRDSMRKMMVIAGAVLGVLGIAGLGYSYIVSRPDDPDPTELTSTAGETSTNTQASQGEGNAADGPEGRGPEGTTQTEGPTKALPLLLTPDAGESEDASTDAGEADGQAADAETDASETDSRPRTLKVRRGNPRPVVLAGPPRTVTFRIMPGNVSVAIDGGVLRELTTSYRSAQLPPGRHSFRIVGSLNCCEEERFSVLIPPGQDDYVLRRTLRYKPAQFYVRGTPAAVSIQGQRGRAMRHIPVPMTSTRRTVSFTVRAPGFRPYQAHAELIAGQQTEVRPTLVPLAEGEDSPPAEPRTNDGEERTTEVTAMAEVEPEAG